MQHRHVAGLMFALMFLLMSTATPFSGAQAATGSTPYVGFRKQTTAANFAGSKLAGVKIGSVAGNASIQLAASGLRHGTNSRLYGSRSYWYGTLESPVFSAAHLFDTTVASWNARTPGSTWIQVELRAYKPAGNQWTKYYNMGIWASGTATLRRHSVNRQGDRDGYVATDSLLLYGQPVYTRYQYRLTLFTTDRNVSPSVSLMAVMTSNTYRQPAGLNLGSDRIAWGIDLPVPQRSQLLYKGGGEVWCSPTSSSMIAAYFGNSVPVPQAAAGPYHYVYQGNGNWPFNTAWAASLGLEAYVTRMSSMTQIEEWIKARVPVAISFGYGPGELPGTPIRSSAGHLMVLRGFDANGNVIVNDPAARSNDAVRIVYDRAKLERVWLKYSGGTVYLIYPKGTRVPVKNAYGSW